MKALAAGLGREAGLNETEMADLSLLAEAHNLGYIALPEQVLRKKGKLTELEKDQVVQHAEKGYRIAISSPDLARIAELILYHHENWDGSGYPSALSGKRIPLACRILAIADSYAAMTEDRPYRRALEQKEAVAELKRCSGTRFDPHLIDLFLSKVVL